MERFCHEQSCRSASQGAAASHATFPVFSTIGSAQRRAKDISFPKAAAAGVDLESFLKRPRAHAETMGKVADALEKLHEERGMDTPTVRPCDVHITEESRRGNQR